MEQNVCVINLAYSIGTVFFFFFFYVGLSEELYYQFFHMYSCHALSS
jgi:hypothetical protein